MQLLERNIEYIDKPHKGDTVYFATDVAPTHQSNETRVVKTGEVHETPRDSSAKLAIKYAMGSVSVSAKIAPEKVFSPFEMADVIDGEVPGGELMSPQQTAKFLDNPDSLHDAMVSRAIVNSMAVETELRSAEHSNDQ